MKIDMDFLFMKKIQRIKNKKMKLNRYDLELYRENDVIPYVKGVAIEGIKKITFYKGNIPQKENTKKEGLPALLDRLGDFIEKEDLGEYIIKLKKKKTE
jgi:hypothetical protein